MHRFDANRIWCAVVGLAGELLAWTQLLAFTVHDARRWEPKKLRLRIFTVPATLARTGRQMLLHLNQSAPWATLVADGFLRLRVLAEPG